MAEAAAKTPIAALPGGPLRGRIRVPGDASIAQRALMLGAVTVGETRIDGLPEAADVIATAVALRALGARIIRDGDGAWRIAGLGTGGLLEPESILDFGGAGYGVRLAIGLVGGNAVSATFVGDVAASRRSLGRVLDPLRLMGVEVIARKGDLMPLSLRGPDALIPIRYRPAAPSALVKSAVLFAGLNAPGVTTVIEPVATRDHSERMLAACGAAVAIDRGPDGARLIRLQGRPSLQPCSLTIPGDPAAAAFALVAAAIVPGSDVTVEGMLLNPLRTGLLAALAEMGADIAIDDERPAGGETVGDVRVRAGRLKAVRVPAELAASMRDDHPLLAVAGAFAEGTTVMEGLEGDGIAALAGGLAANGVEAVASGSTLAVTGGARRIGGSGTATAPDHRIAMALLVLGLAGTDRVAIADAGPIDFRFPGLLDLMRGLGAGFEAADGDG